jgi:hypothetical protein
MADSTKYNVSLAWRTLAKDVFQLTRETVDDPATYRMTVSAIDTNDLGQGEKAIGYTFTDNFGTPYKIIAVDTTTIDVEDIFRTGYCPTSGKEGWVHKSAYKGYSFNLPASLFWNLHPMAASNNNKYAMSILWQNDPNGRRIPFTSVLMPAIADYRGTLTDEDGVVFKPEEDYGQNPQFEIWQILEDGTYSQLSIYPNITRSIVDGLIDSVLFSGTGEEITGYILIKN